MENLNRTITRAVVELVTKKDIHKVSLGPDGFDTEFFKTSKEG